MSSPEYKPPSTGSEFPEPNVQSFIVKIWVEETTKEAGEAHWRGSITHVGSGVRKYVKSLDEITNCLLPYLREMGV
jgi:hypothetical protein